MVHGKLSTNEGMPPYSQRSVHIEPNVVIIRPREHPVTLLIIYPGEWCVFCCHNISRQIFGGCRRYGGCGGQGQGVREGMQYVYRCCIWWRRGQRGYKVGGGGKSKQKPKKPSSGEMGRSTRST